MKDCSFVSGLSSLFLVRCEENGYLRQSTQSASLLGFKFIKFWLLSSAVSALIWSVFAPSQTPNVFLWFLLIIHTRNNTSYTICLIRLEVEYRCCMEPLFSGQQSCSRLGASYTWPILWPPRILTFPPGTPILGAQAKPLYSQMPLSRKPFRIGHMLI